MKRKAFTMVEVLVVITLTIFVMYFAYEIFFSQTKAVTRSIEHLKVNEGFRKVLAFMGDDIHEAANILYPLPIPMENVGSLKTKTGKILVTQSHIINPRIRFDSPLGGQVAIRRTITYALEDMNSGVKGDVPLYKLVRYETVEEKNGSKNTRRLALVGNIREFLVYRTVRVPYEISNVSSVKDRIIKARPLSVTGTGGNLVHVKMAIERTRSGSEKGGVYNISMETDFYKRGKEIFNNP